MNLKDEVKKILEQLDLDNPQVEILEESGAKIMAQVVSTSFEGMDDWKRQRLVLSKLRESLGEDRSQWVEFVFTSTPGEVEASHSTELEARG